MARLEAPCSSSRIASTLAVWARASNRFENTTSPKVDAEDGRKRLSEYSGPSQCATILSLSVLSLDNAELISVGGNVAGPYVTERASTISSTVNPSVLSHS